MAKAGMVVESSSVHRDKEGRLICNQFTPRARHFSSLITRYHEYRVVYVYSHAKGRDWSIPERYRTGQINWLMFLVDYLRLKGARNGTG